MQFTKALALFVTLVSTAAAIAIPNEGVEGHAEGQLEKRKILPGFQCTPGKNQCWGDYGCYLNDCSDPNSGFVCTGGC
ncbi:hypothetical protein EV356DRAFT_502925 [Viridothelium virens]|uniref:Uncharacterized protein n=1 Tax=Viridothelium virens TaxID=1048519 RepID=A0A6A6H796_VIRVR|nr:hypothetical protein EV356DRAFT_502925 [Viridothelium virens]